MLRTWIVKWFTFGVVGLVSFHFQILFLAKFIGNSFRFCCKSTKIYSIKFRCMCFRLLKILPMQLSFLETKEIYGRPRYERPWEFHSTLVKLCYHSITCTSIYNVHIASMYLSYNSNAQPTTHVQEGSTMENHLVLLYQQLLYIVNVHCYIECLHVLGDCFEWIHCIIDPILPNIRRKKSLAYLHRGTLWNSGFQTTSYACVDIEKRRFICSYIYFCLYFTMHFIHSELFQIKMWEFVREYF